MRPVARPYPGPASPYRAAKALLGLPLPPDHRVWAAPEEPWKDKDRCLSLAAPGWLLQSTAGDGIVRLVNHGSDQLGRHLRPLRPRRILITRGSFTRR
ncbi:DUF2264 domain-containing protein [Streptomyces acidiscabies]|uniref:DUF2264 domain-containing protein n=1 Tax=Streptomyces acidiscabies TaxID=42234 RepID=UPI00274005D1|nr:DUF2264 domain-containing protein [Streptomyces acidiscabies]